MINCRDCIIYETQLKQTRSLDELLKHRMERYSGMGFNDYLHHLIEKKNLSKSRVYARTQMGRTYIYQIFSGKRHPSRDKLLQIASAMNCSLEETQSLLMLSQHVPLNFRERRDTIIAYCLTHQYDTFDLNSLLYDYDEEPLFNLE